MARLPDLPAVARTLRRIPFPSRFAVEIAAECNLRCSMCFHPQMRRLKGVLPFELWKKCADEVASVAPATEVWFSFCGEPLLAPDLLLRCIDYGREVGLRAINLNTNGLLLERALAEPILAAGLKRIVFGVDAFTAPTYAKIRVGGDRDTLYANIEHLLALRQRREDGADVMVQFIVMDENEHELPAFQEHWLRCGATLKVRHQLSWGGKFETALCAPQEERIPCPWAITMMHVFWDGRVPRCPGDMEGEEGVGNVAGESIADLWARLGQYRDLHMARRYGELPLRCHDCKDWMVGISERIRPEDQA